MVKLQPESNRQAIQRRLNWIYPSILLVFILLGVRLWWLQILQGAEYKRLAEENRTRSIQVVAPRGSILDRNRTPLVDNRPSLNIILYRELMKDLAGTTAFVTEKLGISTADFSAQLRRNRRAGSYHPIVIKEDVSIEDVSVVEAQKREHPEIQLGPEPRRLYKFGNLAAHVLGYVGEVSEEDLSGNVFPGVQGGELVGRAGVERIYNQCLMGENGAREVMVDSLGRELGIVAEKDAVIGGDLQLTLDYDLQSRAESLLAGSVGAIVAMDPRNGEILAMAGAPSFNPNSFSSRISPEEWSSLANNPDHPLQNRAVHNTYPPGSIFKLIVAEAGLEEGFIEDHTHVICQGAEIFYNTVRHCWYASGHGYTELEGAIKNSCNIFFYTVGQRMGIEKISRHAKEFGFGEKTGVDLPGERPGIVPPGPRWFAGETISVAIGQGPINATPLQVVRAVSAIATDGKLVTPHLLLKAEKGPTPERWPEVQIPLKPENARRIRAGMWDSVNSYGTGQGALLPGLDICGKTGTVQVISAETKKGLKQPSEDYGNHAWFAGFASRDNPEIAVVVFIEHGGGGGAAAAPMAKEIFRAYFAKRGHPELVEKSGAAPAPGERR
jgi:penicillin-binding protein 2